MAARAVTGEAKEIRPGQQGVIRYREVGGGSALLFVPEDRPARLAELIAGFLRGRANAGAGGGFA